MWLTLLAMRNAIAVLMAALAMVVLGNADGPRVQITKGLGPDDQVILQGKELVRDGQTVKAVPAKAY